MAQLYMNGYPIIYRPNHPRCNHDGYIYQHIEVAENKIGRFLKYGEVVHHRDQNRSNNDPSNLLIFLLNQTILHFTNIIVMNLYLNNWMMVLIQ